MLLAASVNIAFVTKQKGGVGTRQLGMIWCCRRGVWWRL